MGPNTAISAIVKWWLKHRGVSIGKNWSIAGVPIVKRHRDSTISIGNNVTMISWSHYTAMGVAHPVVLRTFTKSARIEIGDNTGLSGTTICAQSSISIGRECLIGADVCIVDTDFHPLAPENRRAMPITAAHTAPVIVEDNVFIGAKSIILKGVRIGRNSVIGAGSVVVSDVPADMIAAGNPCRVLRPIGQST